MPESDPRPGVSGEADKAEEISRGGIRIAAAVIAFALAREKRFYSRASVSQRSRSTRYSSCGNDNSPSSGVIASAALLFAIRLMGGTTSCQTQRVTDTAKEKKKKGETARRVSVDPSVRLLLSAVRFVSESKASETKCSTVISNRYLRSVRLGKTFTNNPAFLGVFVQKRFSLCVV